MSPALLPSLLLLKMEYSFESFSESMTKRPLSKLIDADAEESWKIDCSLWERTTPFMVATSSGYFSKDISKLSSLEEDGK